MPERPLQPNIICRHCGSSQSCKADSGRQRYYCLACKRKLIESPPNSKPRPSQSHLILELLAIAQKYNRTPTIKDIQQLARAKAAHSLNTYYQVFGNYRKALKQAGLKNRFDRELDRERLLEELRSLHENLKRPLLVKDVWESRKAGKVSTPIHFLQAFGSISKALQQAGVGVKTYTREDMIEIIREIDIKQDRLVMGPDIDALFRAGKGPSRQSVEREFGGMAKARLAASAKTDFGDGCLPIQKWRKYTPGQIILQIQTLGKRLGRKPTYLDINQASKDGLCASAVTVASMFGSLPEAYRRAGYENVKPRFYTDAEIISAVKELAKEKGRMPSADELVESSKAGKTPSMATISKRIGSLMELRSRLGLPSPIPKPEQIIAQLKELGDRLGRRPTYHDIGLASKEGRGASRKLIEKTFGSLSKAFQKAGFKKIQKSLYTDKDIISAVRKLAKEKRRMPTNAELNASSKIGKTPGVNTIRRRIGDFQKLKSLLSFADEKP